MIKGIWMIGFMFIARPLFAVDDQPIDQTLSEVTARAVSSDALALPDLSQFSTDGIRDMAAKEKNSHQSIDIEISRFWDHDELLRFTRDGNLPVYLQKQGKLPEAIVIKEGVATLAELNRIINDDQVIKRLEDKTYLLRRPILVKHGSSLLIEEGEELRLSEERGAFLVNSGQLFVLDSIVAGWREEKQQPALYSGDEKAFRPFILAWSNSLTYAGNSTFQSLGYLKGKSYGLSLSMGPAQLVQSGEKLDHPTGWLIGNYFTDLYYGFYSYEANDVVIANNQYEKNIVYAIDPHDRSERLIISGNKTFGTKKKHGIIVSREVINSFIINNVSFNNNGSGIMLDRTSTKNLIYNNSTFNNKGDGITLYESSDALIYKNNVFDNKRDGIRMRNSQNVIVVKNKIMANKGVGVYGYIKEEIEGRNLELDPFEPKSSIDLLVSNQIEANTTGAFQFDGLDFSIFGKNQLDHNGRGVFKGDYSRYESQLLNYIYKEQKTVLIEAETETEIENI
ncbi:right-handed parallel beta-helix repeat-containing protein [Endozoicomonas arenosclerae]|uniref:right-handed parallel beta-helix repeat-containing protein n=1 Tax=Endozoicomonas arenosclerae TaxID=1633495 RepID=UPI0007828FC8|nr:NosD domain-containing protein [Endozoicomonas arenosclerae]